MKMVMTTLHRTSIGEALGFAVAVMVLVQHA